MTTAPEVSKPTALRSGTARLVWLAIMVVIVLVGLCLSYGPFIASVVAFVLAGLMLTTGWLTRRKPIIVAGFIFGIAAAPLLLVASLFFGRPVTSPASWPLQFKEMVEATKADTSDAKIWQLTDFLDTEAVWRLQLSHKQFNTVVSETTELVECDGDIVPPQFCEAFPFWWRPTANNQCQFFTTPNFPWTSRGQDGNNVAMMYDPETHYLYVWNKDNF